MVLVSLKLRNNPCKPS